MTDRALSTTPQVLIADDQALVRSGFRMILDAAGIEVIGEAADGEAAADLAARLRPDVVLMDIRMPALDGLRATKHILARDTGCRVIMLTTFDLDRYVFQALRIGASGFLLKDVTPEYLVTAVASVYAGDALLPPSVTRRLIEQFAGNSPRRDGTGAGRAQLPLGSRPRGRFGRWPDRHADCRATDRIRSQLARGMGGAHSAGAGGAGEARPRTVERRPRRASAPRPRAGEDARRANLQQARTAGPRAGSGARLRARPDAARDASG